MCAEGKQHATVNNLLQMAGIKGNFANILFPAGFRWCKWNKIFQYGHFVLTVVYFAVLYCA